VRSGADTLSFSAPVPWGTAKKAILKGPAGKLWKPGRRAGGRRGRLGNQIRKSLPGELRIHPGGAGGHRG
jgi:hypothetical protein